MITTTEKSKSIPDYIIIEKETDDDKKTIKRVRIRKITNNLITENNIISKQEVIGILNECSIYTATKAKNISDDIKDNMLEYWEIREEVSAVPKNSPVFIRTASNNNLEDNLGNLPPIKETFKEHYKKRLS